MVTIGDEERFASGYSDEINTVLNIMDSSPKDLTLKQAIDD